MLDLNQSIKLLAFELVSNVVRYCDHHHCEQEFALIVTLCLFSSVISFHLVSPRTLRRLVIVFVTLSTHFDGRYQMNLSWISGRLIQPVPLGFLPPLFPEEFLGVK